MADPIDPLAKHIHINTFWKITQGQGKDNVFVVTDMHEDNPLEGSSATVRLLGSKETARVPLDGRWETGFEKIIVCPDCNAPLPSHQLTCKYALMEGEQTQGDDAEEFLNDVVGPDKQVEIAPPVQQEVQKTHQVMDDVVSHVKTSEYPDTFYLRRCAVCLRQVFFVYEGDDLVLQWNCQHQGEMQTVVVRQPMDTRERLEELLEAAQDMLAAMENGSWSDDAIRLECARSLVHLKDTEWGELGGRD